MAGDYFYSITGDCAVNSLGFLNAILVVGALVFFMRGKSAAKNVILAITALWALGGVAISKAFKLDWSVASAYSSNAIQLISAALLLCWFWNKIFGLSKEDKAKAAAGKKAEAAVAKVLDRFTSGLTAQTMHGTLLLFNEGLPNEFSSEIDHLLITERNVFLIETKMKSGKVNACIDLQEWEVVNGEHKSMMRNPLKQAQNTLGVLRRELGIEATPVVVFVGKDTRILNGPFNVVELSNLKETIKAFENSSETSVNAVDVVSKIKSAQRTGSNQMARHIKRANEAALKAKRGHGSTLPA